MWRAKFEEFARDESGGGTIMGLYWFITLVMICGLAVDITDGFRARTMLQATADATALAGAIDLPDRNTVAAAAVTNAYDNMPQGENGTVLRSTDVIVGKWDGATKAIDQNDPEPDAVMVTVHRSSANENAMPVNFLRIIGLYNWEITTQAVAQRFIPECLRDGLIAREIVDISSNNDFVREICVHGQLGVDMQNGNYHELGVTVSMPKLDMLTIPTGGMESNPGLPEALRENILDPRMVNHVDEIMRSMIDQTNTVIPEYIQPYIDLTDPDVFQIVDEKFDLSTAVPGRIYKVECAPNKNAQIPANSIVDSVIVIAECEIKVNAGATITNTVLGSLSGGNPGQGQGGGVSSANINIAANVQLGLPDNCADGGGLLLLSNATIHTAATTSIDGVQMVAAGDIELGARDEGINGISAQSGGTIKLTSNNQFGLCAGGGPNLFTVPYYRLVL
ncbi:MAG: Tad domain-containing protein [Paracoccaceae bacterium]|nr:Tad domain-containing protein [Paracoccaceae bacterium]